MSVPAVVPTPTPVALPARLQPLLAGVRDLAGVDFAAEGAGGRAGWLVGLRQLVDAAEVAFTHALASFDAAGDGQVLTGAQSSAAWLRAQLHLAPGDASARVHVARQRGLLTSTLQQVHTGAVTFDQATAVEKAIRPLPDTAKPDAVTLLTGLARVTDASAVRVAGRRLREVVDPDGALADAERQFDRRYLTLSPLLDGMTSLQGLLDAEATAILDAALAPFLVPAGPDDDRTPAQRRADGLTDLAALALRTEQLPVLAGAVAAVDVLISIDDLTGGRGVATPGGQWLSGAAVGRLGCDANVTRIVCGPDSVPLDVGRTQRLFTPAQRKALAARDGGCRFPGCTRPPRHTDAHHLIAWLDGGPTDLDNGLLLCRWHHRRTHEGRWTITPEVTSQGAHGTLWFHSPRGQHHRSNPRAGP